MPKYLRHSETTLATVSRLYYNYMIFRL